MYQFPLALIPHEIEGEIIHLRAKDGYINATAMCQLANKSFHDYSRLKVTGEFLTELSNETGIPVSELIQTFKGGRVENQGTWIHPQVGINLAQWLSPKFAVRVSGWIYEWMNGGGVPSTKLPVHLERYMINRAAIPHTHFSILNELTFNLVAPLEQAGYTLPENMVPDISQGQVFSKWLRENRGVEPKTFPTYAHKYPDGRIYPARLYPNEYLADFKEHFNTVWLPNHAPKYFGERDKKALGLIEKILLPDLS
ncbi:KilA-N domain-containing protein [Limnobaculum xujianqingii]|uniref:KilA-N domain-containing protein n=1 Tax=Limnobaculum xujianqingii TaxID=2738837 RepID=UPI001128BF29|nr:KilA-N domain-containing protein [Limnobaculum xujianqingii]